MIVTGNFNNINRQTDIQTDNGHDYIMLHSVGAGHNKDVTRSFSVILSTDRQTDKHTDTGENVIYLAEVIS